MLFLFILSLILLIQLCNLYSMYRTKKNLLSIIGVIVVLFLSIYEIFTKKHINKPDYRHIDRIQKLILIICFISVLFYCFNINQIKPNIIFI